MSYTLYIGIDLGKQNHIAAFISKELLERHRRYSACPTLPVPNLATGFDVLLQTIEKYSTRAETCVLLEHTGHYGVPLIQFLQEHGVTIYHMQVAKRTSWDKTDVKDAQALGNLLYNTVAMGVQTDKSQRIAILSPLPETVRKLRGLVRHRYELVSETTQRKNKLTAICDQLFPELTQIYKDPNKPSALNLREQFPTARAVAEALIDDLCATRLHTQPSRAQLLKLQELARCSIGTHDDARCFSLVFEQRQLIGELRLLTSNLDELNEQIIAISSASREGQILLSFGCVGPVQAGILVSGICPIVNFESPSKLKGYVWPPRRVQTGTTLDKTVPKKSGNRMLKQTMYMIVVGALKNHDSPWRVLYDRLVKRKCDYDERTGKYKLTIKVIARIAQQILEVMWKLLKKDYDLLQSLEPGEKPPAPTLYDEKRHKHDTRVKVPRSDGLKRAMSWLDQYRDENRDQ